MPSSPFIPIFPTREDEVLLMRLTRREFAQLKKRGKLPQVRFKHKRPRKPDDR